MFNHQDVTILCLACKLPHPLWKIGGGAKGARQRGQVVTCPTTDPGLILKVFYDMPVRPVAGVQIALRFSMSSTTYAWCRKGDKKRRPLVFKTVRR